MKILYLLSDPTWQSAHRATGYSTHVEETMRALRAAGHEVDVLDCRRGGDKATSAARLGGPRTRPAQSYLPSRVRAVGRDLSYLLHNRRVRPALAARLERGDVDVVYERFHHLQSAGVETSRAHGVPIVLEFNAGQNEIVEHQEPGWVSLARRAERHILSRADRVVAVSESLRRYAIGSGVPEERLVVLHNAVDTERFRPDLDGASTRARWSLAAEDFVVGFVGSLAEWHGLETLVDAVAMARAEVPHLRLLVLGGTAGTAAYERVRARVEQAGLQEAVRLAGQVPHERVPEHLAAMDVAAMPWTNEYGSPLKIFEYLAMGKPVIAPDRPVIREILVPETDAILVPREPAALARAIVRLSADPTLRARLSSRGRALALERHSWRRNAATLNRWFEELRSRAASARGLG